MNTSMPVGDPPMSFNFCASNDSGDYTNSGGGQWQIDPNKYFTSDGTWITPPQEYVTDGTAGNIPWIIDNPNILNIPPLNITIATVGTLRLNPTTGMIERWDGTNWAEYGKPLTPPPGIVEPPKAENDFELGGAL